MPSLPGLIPSPTLFRRGRRSRLLYHWRARDLSIDALTGQLGTFSRASIGGAIADRAGRLWTPVHSQARWDVPVVGGEAGLRIEVARTNLLTQSENFGAWTAMNAPVLTPGIADPFGGTAAYQIEDTGVNPQYIYLVPTFNGDGIKCYAVFVNGAIAGTFTLRLQDQTGGVTVGQFDGTVAGGVVSGTASVGTLLKIRAGADGWYRVEMQTAAVTAINTHRLEIRPTNTTSASAGKVIAFGAQAEDAVYCSSYIRTSGGTIPRATDRLTHPLNLGPLTAATDDLTLYARFARPSHADASGSIVDTPGILSLGGGAADLGLYFSTASRQLNARVRDGASTAASVQAGIPAGADIEICAQFRDLVVTPAVALDVGTGLSAFATNGLLPLSTFGTPLFGLGEIANGAQKLGGTLFEAKVAAGLLTTDQMREAL